MNLKKAETKVVAIGEVEVWKDNPRKVTQKGIAALREQIKELGVYKPLVCCRENGRYITLGGNQRLVVLREFKQKEVEIKVVKARTMAEKIKYALSDNDEIGETDREALAEMVQPHVEEINLEVYSIGEGKSKNLKGVLEEFGPTVEDIGSELDITPELMEAQNYVVLTFENEMDWKVAIEALGLKPVGALDSRKGYERVGIGRVVSGKEVIRKIIE